MTRRGHDPEIAPDEIFLDASNLPDFDPGRLEGRLERPLSKRSAIGVTLAALAMFLLFAGQAWSLQVTNGEAYALQSERNRLRPEILFAERGAVLDRNGTVLIANEEGDDGVLRRVYAEGGVSQVLGYVSYPKKDSSGNYYDTDIIGLAGAEASFDGIVSGENGLLLIEEDALGNIRSKGTVVPPENGTTLELAIDVRAERAFSRAIAELAEQVPFGGGAGVLMDVETGEVHALVSYPLYDSNVLSSGNPAATIASYLEDPREPYLNRAVAGLYAPGSIVKTIVAAGALTDNIITPDSVIVSTGSISVPNPYDPEHPTVFPDWKPLGPLDLRGALAMSSDVYFYTVGGGFGTQKGLGIDRLAYWYRTFGLGEETGIELPSEATGFIPTPAWKEETYDEIWRIGNTYHTAIGQYAMQITPIAAARAVAAVANGGKLVRPTLRKDAPLSGESIPVDSDALRVVREGMRQGVTNGTVTGLSLPFVSIAAKTGTAQVGARNEYVNSWVTGFFPYEHPRYAFVIVMDRGPAGNLIGGVYAARQALEELSITAPEYFE